MPHAFTDGVFLEPTIVVSAGDALFRMANTLLEAGYQRLDAGDGLGAREIHHGGSGEGGLDNLLAWQRLASPDGRREWTTQVIAPLETAAVRVRYAIDAPFLHGVLSPSQAPVSMGEVPLLGGGAANAPTGAPLYSKVFGQTEAKLIGGVSRHPPWNFWFAVVQKPLQTLFHLWVFDSVSAIQGDSDPTVHVLKSGDVPEARAHHAGAFRRLALGGELCTVVNPYNGRIDLTPVVFNSDRGLKGTSQVLLWNPLQPLAVFTSVQTSRRYISAGKFALPWGDSTPEGYADEVVNTVAADEIQPVRRRLGGLGGEI